jgi:hypothetical protein
LKTYQSHKRVLAAKIASIVPATETEMGLITMDDGDFCRVPPAWLEKHKPEVGGYFVEYKDGYQSYSPAQPFEEGNTEVVDAGSDQAIEQEIRAKGKTAPRVTPADIEANIASEYFFTAAEGVAGHARGGRITGNDSRPLHLLTFCVLVLKNGFTVTGESACASPKNFDAEIGRKIARANAVQKIWPLMGYALKSRLAIDPTFSRRPNPADGAPKPAGHNPVA